MGMPSGEVLKRWEGGAFCAGFKDTLFERFYQKTTKCFSKGMKQEDVNHLFKGLGSLFFGGLTKLFVTIVV